MGAENPAHYKSHPSGIECIQVIYPLHYGAGNAIKYLWRLGAKDEDLQELKKAMWYTKHCIDADLDGNPDRLPFDSRQAFYVWADAEPDGYRLTAILYIYAGNYAKALAVMEDWYLAITGGTEVPDIAVPSVHSHTWKEMMEEDARRIAGVQNAE